MRVFWDRSVRRKKSIICCKNIVLVEREWIDMITELNDKDKTRYIITTIILTVDLTVMILFSVMVGSMV